MSKASKDLLGLEDEKNFASSKLLIFDEDSDNSGSSNSDSDDDLLPVPFPKKPGQKPGIHAVPESLLIGKLQDFLPRLDLANKELSQRILEEGTPAKFDIENIESADKPHIEMDLQFMFDVLGSEGSGSITERLEKYFEGLTGKTSEGVLVSEVENKE